MSCSGVVSRAGAPRACENAGGHHLGSGAHMPLELRGLKPRAGWRGKQMLLRTAKSVGKSGREATRDCEERQPERDGGCELERDDQRFARGGRGGPTLPGAAGGHHPLRRERRRSAPTRRTMPTRKGAAQRGRRGDHEELGGRATRGRPADRSQTTASEKKTGRHDSRCRRGSRRIEEEQADQPLCPAFRRGPGARAGRRSQEAIERHEGLQRGGAACGRPRPRAGPEARIHPRGW